MGSLFVLKVVPEVIDPVMGPFQLGGIQRQIRTIEATNIRRSVRIVSCPEVVRFTGDSECGLFGPENDLLHLLRAETLRCALLREIRSNNPCLE
jgi:hypothetical protein